MSNEDQLRAKKLRVAEGSCAVCDVRLVVAIPTHSGIRESLGGGEAGYCGCCRVWHVLAGADLLQAIEDRNGFIPDVCIEASDARFQIGENALVLARSDGRAHLARPTGVGA